MVINSAVGQSVRPCSGGSVVIPDLKVKDEKGVIKCIKLSPLGATVDDYSLRNLDKAGVVVNETSPSDFRPATLDTSDSLINAATQYSKKINVNYES